MIKKKLHNKIEFAQFVLPILFLYTIFFLIPLVQGIIYSFTKWNGIDIELEFVGFNNYIQAFKDEYFINSIRFTLVFTLLYTIFVNILGLSSALLLNNQMRSNKIMRTIIFSPFILNIVTIGFVWQFLLGRFTNSLYSMTGSIFFSVSWLGDKNIVIYTVLIVKIWQSMGYFMVIYLAGLQMIPQDIVESASIDGAKRFSMFTRIVFPLLSNSTTVCVFFALISALQIFPLVMTLTNGGPGHATESIALYVYTQAFSVLKYGYASALGIIFMVIILLITIMQLIFFKKREIDL